MCILQNSCDASMRYYTEHQLTVSTHTITLSHTHLLLSHYLFLLYQSSICWSLSLSSLLLFPLCSLHTCSLFSLSHYIFVAVFQLILRYFRILTFTSFLLQFPTSIFPYTSLPNCFDCTSHLLWHNKIRHPPHISNHIFVFQTCFVLTLPIRGDHIPKPLRFSRGCTPG